MAETRRPWHPVAVGGIGGSGTRVFASLLQAFGYYLGDDLGPALDNRWFILLFKRRSVLLETAEGFAQLCALFFGRMNGNATIASGQLSRIVALAAHDRVQHPREWLRERVRSFCDAPGSRSTNQPWGWKEPNTHIVIDRMLLHEPDLRYVHVYRHPLYMSLSRNLNQLRNWGAVFLDREPAIEPRWALAYWCAVHRRALAVVRQWPDRALAVDFDAFCTAPRRHCREIAALAGAEPPADVLAQFCAGVSPPRDLREGDFDATQYDPADLAYVSEIGYRL